jgi:hypothetical protein
MPKYNLNDRVSWWGREGRIISLIDTPAAIVEFDDGSRLTCGRSVLAQIEEH